MSVGGIDLQLVDPELVNALERACRNDEAIEYLSGALTEPHVAAPIARAVLNLIGRADIVGDVDKDAERLFGGPAMPVSVAAAVLHCLQEADRRQLDEVSALTLEPYDARLKALLGPERIVEILADDFPFHGKIRDR